MAEVQTAARLGEFGILLGGDTIKAGATFDVRSYAIEEMTEMKLVVYNWW